MFPIGLAPHQWDPLLPELRARFTVIRVSGAEMGSVQGMEGRAEEQGYREMVSLLWDHLNVGPSQHIVEVGPGSGVLLRQLHERLGGGASLTGVEISDFMRDEAAVIADAECGPGAVEFTQGDALALPFEDASVDAIFSVTVFEECDADRAIVEMHRVLKPGGRAGVVVRSRDLPHQWGIDLPDHISRRIDGPSADAPVEEDGCADASLYTRFAPHFEAVRPFPFWTVSAPPMLSQGRPSGRPTGHERRRLVPGWGRQGRRGQNRVHAVPYHCVAGTKAAE